MAAIIIIIAPCAWRRHRRCCDGLPPCDHCEELYIRARRNRQPGGLACHWAGDSQYVFNIQPAARPSTARTAARRARTSETGRYAAHIQCPAWRELRANRMFPPRGSVDGSHGQIARAHSAQSESSAHAHVRELCKRSTLGRLRSHRVPRPRKRRYKSSPRACQFGLADGATPERAKWRSDSAEKPSGN